MSFLRGACTRHCRGAGRGRVRIAIRETSRVPRGVSTRRGRTTRSNRIREPFSRRAIPTDMTAMGAISTGRGQCARSKRVRRAIRAMTGIKRTGMGRTSRVQARRPKTQVRSATNSEFGRRSANRGLRPAGRTEVQRVLRRFLT